MPRPLNFDEEWESYMRGELPTTLPPDVFLLLQRAFYGGGVAVVGRLQEAYQEKNIMGTFEEIAECQRVIQRFGQGVLAKSREHRHQMNLAVDAIQQFNKDKAQSRKVILK